MIKRLGIIGTAGRKDDKEKLSCQIYELMCDAAQAVIKSRNYTHLVSGGAAWSDHVAVSMVLRDVVPADHLTLHLPAAFINNRFDDRSQDGRTANFYHLSFLQKSGIDGLAEIAEAVRRGAILTVNPKGFLARNIEVANDSDGLLAFTFGNGPPWKIKVYEDVSARAAGLKDGGTAHTFDRCRAKEKYHLTLSAALPVRPTANPIPPESYPESYPESCSGSYPNQVLKRQKL